MDNERPQPVVITGVDIPFRALTWLLLKLTLAVLWLTAMAAVLVAVGALLRVYVTG